MTDCALYGCQARATRRHLCHKHNARLDRIGTTYIHRESVCSRCDRAVVAKGLCQNHYMKLKRTGTFEYFRRRAGEGGGQDHRAKHLWNRYRMTRADYERTEEQQGQACAICEEPQEHHSMFVDHDHATGEVRGLLCRDCNTLLGFLESRDDCDRIIAGVTAYCEAHFI